MQTTFSTIRSLRGIGLLSAVSLLLFSGCSTKHQQSASVGGYYPSHHTGGTYQPGRAGGRFGSTMPRMVQGSEAMHRATLRPYTVFGERYYPRIVPLGTVEQGIASWYGPDFHGKKTSNGEIYDMYAPGTAAHKTLPMNTIVRVTHAETGEQVTVRINDRGPFVEGRIIDLSYTAGKRLGLDVSGIAPVKLEVLQYDDHIMAQNPGGRAPARTRQASRSGSGGSSASVQSTASITPLAPAPVERSRSGGYALQIGAFRSSDGASALARESEGRFAGQRVLIRAGESGGEPIHRVFLGDFESRDEADRFMRQEGISNAVVVNPS